MATEAIEYRLIEADTRRCVASSVETAGTPEIAVARSYGENVVDSLREGSLRLEADGVDVSDNVALPQLSHRSDVFSPDGRYLGCIESHGASHPHGAHHVASSVASLERPIFCDVLIARRWIEEQH